VSVGCCETTSFAAAPGVMLNAALTAELTPVPVAFSR
jgi:hypothetical protein